MKVTGRVLLRQVNGLAVEVAGQGVGEIGVVAGVDEVAGFVSADGDIPGETFGLIIICALAGQGKTTGESALIQRIFFTAFGGGKGECAAEGATHRGGCGVVPVIIFGQVVELVVGGDECMEGIRGTRPRLLGQPVRRG